MADTQVGSHETPEGILQKNEGTTCIESLQVLTSRMPPVENTAVKSGKAVKSKLRRGRKKKKLPVKFPQPTILPKVFAIQIAPQANIIGKSMKRDIIIIVNLVVRVYFYSFMKIASFYPMLVRVFVVNDAHCS